MMGMDSYSERKARREKRLRYVLIDTFLTAKTNPQNAGGDGHGGARGKCDWMWE